MAGKTEITCVYGDLTVQRVDAIVNAANSTLMGGGGVDGAIHRAGGPAILAECVRWVKARGELPPGEAMTTTAGWMEARRVIHTVGPVWAGGTRGEAETLARAYKNSLAEAVREGLGTVAFPSISTGAYGYPVAEAAAVALAAVREFVEAHPGALKEVRFVLHSERDLAVYRAAAL